MLAFRIFPRSWFPLPGAAAVMLAGSLGAAAQPVAAPTPPAPLRRDLGPVPPSPALAAAGAPYSIGEPTDEEQLYLEFINRARANPTAEGARFANETDRDILDAYSQYHVDLALLQTQFSVIPAAAPVSFHPALIEAARRHAHDMFDHSFQGHTGTDGSTVGTRATDAGYRWIFIAENVYSYAKSPWYGHAGFNVDWGNGPGGMQTPPGHRQNIHDAGIREIGIGVIDGTNGTVGPQVVSQALGNRQGITPLLTGVVYYDLNGNQFYDVGEGLGGVTVRISDTTAYAVTSRSGGYSVPLIGSASRTVTFSVPGLADVTRTISPTGTANLKLDLVPAYAAPAIKGSPQPRVGTANAYAFTPVGAATAYQWRSTRRTVWTDPEGAEAGLGRFVADTTPGYDVVDAGQAKSGGASFHLGHVPQPRLQSLTLSQPLRISPASVLTFWSEHRWATTSQVARVQLSTNNGAPWINLWSQAGATSLAGDNPGETEFSLRTISLGDYAASEVRLRFVYEMLPGFYFPTAQSEGGFHVDDIRISEAEFLSDPVIANVPAGATSFPLTPATEDALLLEVRALVGDRMLPWGEALPVQAVVGPANPPTLALGLPSVAAGQRWEIPFRITDGSANAFEVQSANAAAGPWSTVSTATIVPGSGAGAWIARVPVTPSPVGFFRLVVR